MTRLKSLALAERANRVMPGGVSSPVRALTAVQDEPLIIDSALGARVLDADGASAIDYIGSWGAAIVGHAHPHVLQAVGRALRDGLGFGATTRLEIALAEEISRRVSVAEQVRFTCSGTEAVMSAVRLARAATGRSKLVTFAGCYHGHSDSVLHAAGSGLSTLEVVRPQGVPDSIATETVILPYNDVEAVESCFSENGSSLAAVIVEPVAGNMGVVPGRRDFMAALRNLTREHGSLLVFDEVMTGFRLARGGAIELTGIEPDLVTLGKVIGGGLPVAAFAGREKLMRLVAPRGPVYHAGTLAGSPPGMAAGLATLELLDADAYVRLEHSAARLATGLREIFERAGVVVQVQRVGSMLTAFFSTAPVANHSDARAADHETFAAFFRAMRLCGVLLPPSGYESWFVSLAHDDAIVDQTLAAAASALKILPNATPRVTHEPSAHVAPSVHTRVFDSVIDMMPHEGNPSPLVRINRLNPRPAFSLYAKLEWTNPFGSLKDRAAWEMLRDLEERGLVGPHAPGRGLVEPTSGNTGISLAVLAGLRGYRLRAVVPNRVPLEKKLLLRIAGADLEVINDELCPMPGLGDGSINLARSHARSQPGRYVMPNQYANHANVFAHRRTTAPEIWRQTRGTISHLFVSLGTCGTVTGLAGWLRERNPGLRVIAVQPSEGHDVPGLRNVSQLDATELFDASLIDEILEVEFEQAYVRALDLAQQEGLLAGPSSGLVLEGARRIIERDQALSGVGVMIFPDNVFKYAATMARHLPDLERGTAL